MAKNKAYVVWAGRNPGIYKTWPECQAQIKGFPGARYKGFPTRAEAEEAFDSPAQTDTNQRDLYDKDSDHPHLKYLEAGDVVIYSDGGAQGNPGPGGYGVVLLFQEKRKELTGGYRHTTNNRMELMGWIVGLESLKRPCNIKVFSDSRYVGDGFSKGWAENWRRKNWMRTRTEPAKNADLWDRLLKAAEPHTVEFIWVPGHVGIAENERCDELAVAAAKGIELPADQNYEDDTMMPA